MPSSTLFPLDLEYLQMSLKAITKQKILHEGLFVVLLCTIPVLFYMGLDSKKKKNKVVATVNGDPVITSEFRYWMLLNKADVHNHFYRTYEAKYNASFWTTQFDGKTPLKTLKRRSLKNAVRCKIQQQLASELGIQVTMNYRELMEERLKINEIRKKRVEKDEVIYGPVIFTPRTYFSRLRDKMVLKSKHILSERRFKISKSKMETLYEDYKTKRGTFAVEKGMKPEIASFEKFKAVRQNRYTDKKYEQLVGQLISSAKVKINKEIYEKVFIE